MIFLAQTDTTAGFLSKDYKEINKAKMRDENKPCLITTAKFSVLNELVRVPKKYKNFIRHSRKATFLYPNLKAIRVVKECEHEKFLAKFDWLYSSSANKNGQNFNKAWAMSVADEIVDDHFFEDTPSKIYKISRKKIKRLR